MPPFSSPEPQLTSFRTDHRDYLIGHHNDSRRPRHAIEGSWSVAAGRTGKASGGAADNSDQDGAPTGEALQMNIDPITAAIIAILFALIFAAIQLAISYGKPPRPHNRSDAHRRGRPPPGEYL